MSHIETLKPADVPALVTSEENPWAAMARAAYIRPEVAGIRTQAHGDGIQQANLEASGVPKVPTMTAEKQAAGLMDVLLRDWNSGERFSKDQMQQLTKFIRDGVYGLKGPIAIQEQLTAIQNTLNRYLKGGETPFRDSTLPTPLEIRLLVDPENQIRMGIRNNEVKKGVGIVFPLVEGKGPKRPSY